MENLPDNPIQSQNPANIQPQISEALKRVKASDDYLTSAQSDFISHEKESIIAGRVNFDGKTEFGTSNTNIDVVKRQIAACREMYENVGIVGNVVDLMVDFALEGFVIAHNNQPINNFFNNWSKSAKLNDVCGHILKSLFRDGNVPILAEYVEQTAEMETDFKRLITANDQELGIKESSIVERKKNKNHIVGAKTIIDNQIPSKYNIIDIMNLWQDGSELLGTLKYEYQLPTDDVRGLAQNSPEVKAAKKRLAQSLTPKDIAAFEKSGRLPLNKDRFDMIFYKKDMHKHWATPMLHRVIDDVKFKKLLRDMDISVAEGVCNTLTFVTLGDVVAGYPAPAEKYAKMAFLLKNRAKSKIIVWDNLIKVIAEYPPVDKILGKAKYEQVDGDIRSGLGIPEILVNGQGGNYANSFLSVKTLLERLEYGRGLLIEWIQEQLLIITKAMGFRRPPIIKFDHMSLTDETAEKQFILELVDRNMVSSRTALEYAGEDLDIEEMRMKDEDEIREELQDTHPFTLLKTGKFGPMHTNGIIPIGVQAPPPGNGGGQSSPMTQGPNGDAGGRPANTKKKQSKKRNTEPKGQTNKSPKQKVKAEDIDSFIIGAEQVFSAGERFDEIYDILAKDFVELDKIATDKELEDAFDIEIISIMCHLESKPITKENIEKHLEVPIQELAIAPLKLEHCIRDVTKKKVDDFKKKNGHSPNKKQKKAIVSSAWAICRSSLGV